MSDRAPVPVLASVDHGLATLTLNRPERGNAFDQPMLSALVDAVEAVVGDVTLRAVLLRAEGKNFCFGGDVAMFAQSGDDLPDTIRRMTGTFHTALASLAGLGVPTVAAVQGHAAGGGISLALTADLVIAATSAKFTFAYPGIGMSPDGGASWLLPRRVGVGRALDWALTNRPVGAEEAAAAGLVTRVVGDEDLDDAASGLARKLASGPTLALRAAKKLIWDSWLASHSEQLARESEMMTALAASADAKAGIASFVGKTDPVFKGG